MWLRHVSPHSQGAPRGMRIGGGSWLSSVCTGACEPECESDAWGPARHHAVLLRARLTDSSVRWPLPGPACVDGGWSGVWGMDVVVARCAGLDVGKRELVALRAGPGGRRPGGHRDRFPPAGD